MQTSKNRHTQLRACRRQTHGQMWKWFNEVGFFLGDLFYPPLNSCSSLQWWERNRICTFARGICSPTSRWRTWCNLWTCFSRMDSFACIISSLCFTWSSHHAPSLHLHRNFQNLFTSSSLDQVWLSMLVWLKFLATIYKIAVDCWTIFTTLEHGIYS